jgi:hypothetical protein
MVVPSVDVGGSTPTLTILAKQGNTGYLLTVSPFTEHDCLNIRVSLRKRRLIDGDSEAETTLPRFIR